MERLISEMMADYERGVLSRRTLIGTLVAIVAAGKPTAAAGLTGMVLNHVSLQVQDVRRSREFYARVFGMSEPVPATPRADGSVRMDLKTSGFFVLREGSPTGVVDHVAIRLENFNKDDVTRQLREVGVEPVDDPAGVGFHVIDPDGYPVQIQ